MPEPLECADGYEYLRYVPGDAGEASWPHCTSLDGVRSAGTLLRDMHDATASWTPPDNAQWALPAVGQVSVICHGDPKPPNMTWENGRAVGLFDWDMARPGERIDDIAYAIQWIAPFFESSEELARRGLPSDVDTLARATAFLDGYDWTAPIDIEGVVRIRRRQAVDEVESLGRRGIEPQATWLAQGAVAQWRTALGGQSGPTR